MSAANKDAPLKAAVEEDVLIIRIGIDTLEFASKPENGGPLENCRVAESAKITWAKDVVREMEHENEIGESPLGLFLDQMMEKAGDNGSAALVWNPKR